MRMRKDLRDMASVFCREGSPRLLRMASCCAPGVPRMLRGVVTCVCRWRVWAATLMC